MKTTTFPSLRTTPELKQAAEEVQQQFIACGLRSHDEARQSGKYVSGETVIRRLEQMLLNGK